MSNLVLTASRKYPGIPTVGSTIDSHTKALESIRDAIQTHERRTKDVLSSFVRVQDLITLGFARLDGSNILVPVSVASEVAAGATTLDDLTDVDTTGAADADVLTYDAGSTTWVPAAPGSSGGMQLVGSASVTGAASTSLTINGLDLDADGGRYVVGFEISNATASAANISLFFNADTTTSNYDREVLTASSSSVTASHANDALIAGMNASTATSGDMVIRRRFNATVAAIAYTLRGETSATQFQTFATVWRTASTNVTAITLSSSVASSLAIGSIIKVWKVPS